MDAPPTPALSVVAGCLFEVVLPAAGGRRWRWIPTPEATVLADELRGGRHRFRFRAEAAGALAGSVELRFAPEGADAATGVLVHVAPERWEG